MKKLEARKEIVHTSNGKKEIITLHDEKGKEVHKSISPLRVEFHFRDLLQVIIGASILAIPVGFTEETWHLGESLPFLNVLLLGLLSVLFISAFTYYHYHEEHSDLHWLEFMQRIFMTYVVSFLVVAVIMTLIQRTPWTTDLALAIKRVVIVTFPSSMSAAIADFLK